MRLVVLGNPVTRSRSPAIHRAALEAVGITGDYVAREVDESGVDAALAELRAGELDGANVTMPHKRLAASRCDRLDGDAAAGGVANTLAMREGMLVGWNTDVGAIRAASPPGERTVLVLGAGGAAAAALVAFGDSPLAVSARRPDAALALAERIAPSARSIPWGTPQPGALVVNATAIGMRGESLPHGIVEAASGLIDLPYSDSPTPACLAAQRRGIPWVDGLELLVAQAAASFLIWTGVEAPIAVMRAAARRPSPPR